MRKKKKKKPDSHNRASTAIKCQLATWSRATQRRLLRGCRGNSVPSAEAACQPLECSKSYLLGRSHGLATFLLAVGSGDSGGALRHPSPQDLCREALPGTGRTVLPDV